MGDLRIFLTGLRQLLGTAGFLEDPASCRVYSRDASHLELGRPLAVALPADATELAATVGLCARHGVPVVPRGTGTGLAGGALPPDGAIVLGTSRLDGLAEVDARRRKVQAGAGVLNDQVTRHAAAHGLHFAPDPSSQSAASIGGNVAANAGGPHCLVHGVTRNHLRNLDWVDAVGAAHLSGRGLSAERGFHLTSLLCGSEGTLGVVTSADLNLVPDPAEVTTLLAFFPSLADATRAVVDLLGRGLLPVAVEMVDQAMLKAVEAAFAFGFATDVEAALIAEFAGPAPMVAADSEAASALLTAGGARQVRRAVDPAERAQLWQCRKKAFGAVGRLAPHYVTMDVVVPLGELPGLVADIQEIKARHQVHVATVFHAGDGNLHPGVHYDDRDPAETARAHLAADDIIRWALARGGSCTGEHGVGLEKLHAIPWQLDGPTAALYQDVKNLFDGEGRLNPGKALPAADADFAPPKPVPDHLRVAEENLWVQAPGDLPVSELQAQAVACGLWLPTGLPLADPDLTVARLLDQALYGPSLLGTAGPRDVLLEMWGETGGGRAFHSGEAVFKNVAGYNLGPALCGSGGSLCRVTGATFQVRPVPSAVQVVRGRWDPADGHNLSGLCRHLQRYERPGAAPTLVADATVGEIILLVPGRDTDWDLGRLPEDLTALWPSLQIHEARILTFGEVSTMDLPAWLTRGQTWTALAAAEPEDPAWPEGRFLWQAAPELVWVPAAGVDLPGWHADTVRVDGRVTPWPAPGPRVPVDLLRSLKTLFDPDDCLPTPAWLTGGDHD